MVVACNHAIPGNAALQGGGLHKPAESRCIMLQLDDIRNNEALLNAIDWDMTHEEAVRLYLEWGNNWTRGNYVIRSKNDVSHYFIVNTWEGEPVVYLMRRNSDEAVELAKIRAPKEITKGFLESIGYNRGVYSITGEVKDWLKRILIDASGSISDKTQ